MNLRDVEYIIKIEEYGNLAAAAAALYVTPSALSQNLSKIEEDLGTPLFFRTRGRWQTTPAGAEYISACRKILDIKEDAYRRIHDIADVRKGSLRIAMPPERASFIIRNVYPQFHKEYSGIKLNFIEGTVRDQQKLIDAGELDLGLVTLMEKDKDNNSYILLSKEELFLAVPADDERCASARINEKSAYPEIDLKLFDDAPFALMYRDSTLRPVQEDVFSRHHVTPQILFEASRYEIVLDMISEGICCGLLPDTYLRRGDESFRYFALTDHPRWAVCLFYKRGRYLTKAERRFIELTKNFWRQMIRNRQPSSMKDIIS